MVGAVNLAGRKLRRFRFASIANADTFDSKLHNIVEFAVGTGGIGGANDGTQAVADGYSPSTLGLPKAIRAVFDDSAGLGQFTFTVTTGPATNVDLFVWSADS